LSKRLVREDAYENAPAPLDMAGHGAASGFDLTRGQAASGVAFSRNRRKTPCFPCRNASVAPFLLLAVLVLLVEA